MKKSTLGRWRAKKCSFGVTPSSFSDLGQKSSPKICYPFPRVRAQLWPKPSEVSKHTVYMGRNSEKFFSKWCMLEQNVMQETWILNDLIFTNQHSVCWRVRTWRVLKSSHWLPAKWLRPLFNDSDGAVHTRMYCYIILEIYQFQRHVGFNIQ